jgi:hypothetical protein
MAFAAGLWISLLLRATPNAPASPGSGTVPLRAHILELVGIQWRADLLDGLVYVGQDRGATIWTVDAATLRRLVTASSRCLPATTTKGSSFGSGGIAYVASLQRIQKGSAGTRNYSLSFLPQVGNLLDGVELDLTGRPAAGGTLADVTIKDTQLTAIHGVNRSETVNLGSSSTEIAATVQVPEVQQGTVSGRWMIPAGGILVVGLGPHTVGHGTEFRHLIERVLVVDGGDVPASAFVRPPEASGPWWLERLAELAELALVSPVVVGTAALGLAFFAGWFVRGPDPRAWRWRSKRTQSLSNPAERFDQPARQSVDRPGAPDLAEAPRDSTDAPSARRAPPTLAHAMLLIAAMAFPCLVVHAYLGQISPGELWVKVTTAPAGGWTARNVLHSLAEFQAIVGAPFLAAWSVALTLIVLFMPGTSRRRVRGGPGVMSCFLAAITFILGGLALALFPLVTTGLGGIEQVIEVGLYVLPGIVGLAVVSCWITMALLGQWRPEPSWVDRLGRLLGAAWMTSLPFTLSVLV